MKRIKAAVSACFLSVFVFLCSCTAQNDEKPLICQKLGFDMGEKGQIFVTAAYSNSGTSTEKGGNTIIKSYSAKSAAKAVDILISKISDAMYKPLEELIVGKSLDENTKRQLCAKLMNTIELQLKCDVLEYENAASAVRGNVILSRENAVPFTEYYRKKTNGGNLNE